MSYHRTRTGTRKRRSTFVSRGRGVASDSLRGTFVFYKDSDGLTKRAIKAANKQATRSGYVK